MIYLEKSKGAACEDCDESFKPQGDEASIFMNMNMENQYIYGRSASTCTIIEGQWKDGKIHGFGRIIDSIGNVYIGLFDQGIRHGFGRYFWSKGNIYEGEFKNQ